LRPEVWQTEHVDEVGAEAAAPIAAEEKAPAPRTRIGSWQAEPAGDGGTEAAAPIAAKEKASATPSRLNALRALFFVLGSKEAGHLASEEAPAPLPQRTGSLQTASLQAAPVTAQPERATPARNIAPIPEATLAMAAAAGAGSRKDFTRRVTAEPEFLPPQPEKATGNGRRAAFEDVQILPSRRGQYKR
jgi:hypothetical protein